MHVKPAKLIMQAIMATLVDRVVMQVYKVQSVLPTIIDKDDLK